MAENTHNGRQRLDEPEEISILELFNVLLRRRRIVLRSVILVLLGMALVVFLTKRTFTASTSFIPQTPDRRVSGLSGLASQFGFQLPTEHPGESPQFYAELVGSREILGILATEEFDFQWTKRGQMRRMEGTIPDLLELATGEEDPAIRREEAIEWLEEEAIAVSTGRDTGIVDVSISTPWAGLSEALAERLLALVNDFNMGSRQSQAAAERRFVEGRLEEARQQLREAEDRLESFLENNRQFLANRSNSPELSFQHERLQRQVIMQQEVYTSLAEAYEQARIAEVRNTPVITLVEEPELPAEPDPRGAVLKLALGMILGGLVGISLAFLQEAFERARLEQDPKYLEFSGLLSQIGAEMRSLGGLLR